MTRNVSMRFFLPLLSVFSIVLSGCMSSSRPLPEPPAITQLPPVAAQFRTTIITADSQQHPHLDKHHKDKSISEWRFWRNTNRVNREDLQLHTGELWQQDGTTVFHTLLFHDDKRGIEFDQVDLQMSGASTSWQQQVQIVGPDVLSKLKVMKSGWAGEVPFRDYEGNIGAVTWQIRMRLDLMLPVRIEQRTTHESLRIDLLEVHAADDAPWHPTPSAGYGMVDFADLGDHERDPFVVRIQNELGVGHRHAHAH